ncbi:hypothetical protein KY321_02710 [Candidatus Woesearchaeota archaeon]|nr:hypothetical protein [Candidatus Woesearchaeota archaeon]
MDALMIVLEKVKSGDLTKEEAKTIIDSLYNSNSYRTTYIPYYPYKYGTADPYTPPYTITCNETSGTVNYKYDEITAFQ